MRKLRYAARRWAYGTVYPVAYSLTESAHNAVHRFGMRTRIPCDLLDVLDGVSWRYVRVARRLRSAPHEYETTRSFMRHPSNREVSDA